MEDEEVVGVWCSGHLEKPRAYDCGRAPWMRATGKAEGRDEEDQCDKSGVDGIVG